MEFSKGLLLAICGPSAKAAVTTTIGRLADNARQRAEGLGVEHPVGVRCVDATAALAQVAVDWFLARKLAA